VHGRVIDGKSEVFGNAGGLFMSAMTWWDHSTKSIWSQPWGRAIDGPLKGTELDLLPSQVTTWANWREEHPETLVMINDVDRFRTGPEVFFDDFVIGLVLEDAAKAYPYPDVSAVGVVNDMMGEYPVLVWANDDNYHAYLRQVDDRTLTFRWENGQLVDEETGSVWDVMRGRAMSGPLEGQALQSVPSLSSYDWAWRDFYPGSAFYLPPATLEDN